MGSHLALCINPIVRHNRRAQVKIRFYYFSKIRRFRMTGLAEGSSFLLLLFETIRMKSLMGMPKLVTCVGAIHGLLFLL